MIGHPGFGRDAEDYIEEDMAYCMGGTGVIYSNKIIRNIRPYLQNCTKNLFTEHEDIEVSRCFWKHLNIRCTVSYYFLFYLFIFS